MPVGRERFLVRISAWWQKLRGGDFDLPILEKKK
jgi:hypothetical protein